MGFRLKRHERVAPGLIRLLDRDLQRAGRALGGSPVGLDARVHKVRRRLKRDRSLLRVFEPAAPELARAIRRGLRDAGRALAKLRERTALQAAASALRVELDARGRAALEAALTPRSADETRSLQPLQEAAGLIRTARTSARLLPRKGGRKLLDDALARAHRKARKGHRHAAKSLATADLHEWRKELKDLLHLIKLSGDRVAAGNATAKRAGAAERILGDDHDLAALGDRVIRFARDRSGRAKGAATIDARRRRLQKAAFKLGKKIDKAKAPRLRER
ncbi:MAG: CHAD domain-containing protein [Bauldia sp.]|nr:CHAD domain-containing protein [Bauldia sp.]